MRYAFFIDSGQHCAWTEYLSAEPIAGEVIERDGHSYQVNPNPVHTWYEDSETMVMVTVTTVL